MSVYVHHNDDPYTLFPSAKEACEYALRKREVSRTAHIVVRRNDFTLHEQQSASIGRTGELKE